MVWCGVTWCGVTWFGVTWSGACLTHLHQIGSQTEYMLLRAGEEGSLFNATSVDGGRVFSRRTYCLKTASTKRNYILLCV